MLSNRSLKNFSFAIYILVIFSLAACSSAPTQDTFSPTAPTLTSPMGTTPTAAAPTQDTGGLSADDAATLSSLEKLDDYPLYVMHYQGEYQDLWRGANLPTGSSIACSLYASLGKNGDMYYGRNFDWDYSPSLLLFTDLPDGYASVSMVNLAFLRITTEDVMRLTDLPLTERTNLLSAPAMPMDGMNEYGLAIGMAAVPDEFMDDASHDPSLPTIDTLGIIRLLLDHARNVDEAVQLLQQYNIDFTGGPPLHYLLADRSGKAVLVEFYQGEMLILPNEMAWHIATNHMRFNAQGDGGCLRYHILSAKLSASNGELSGVSAMQLLSDVEQVYTQWSAVYDMTSGDVNIVVGRNFSTSYAFHLDLAQP